MMKLLERITSVPVLIGVFIIFTFVYPVKIVSLISGGILALGALVTVTNDEERIKDPYASILGIIVFIAYALLIKVYW